MPRLQLAGIDFNYADTGHGSPIMLLGGTLGTARGDFGPQIDAFSTAMRVIAPDRRGYGETRPPARDFPDGFYRRDAADMAAFVEALDLPPLAVLGWSEGAAVALWLAALVPARVAAVVVWGGISLVADEDIAIFEARRDVTTWPARACAAMTAIYGDGYWQSTWGAWCDVMQRLHAQGGDARLAPLEEITCPVMIVHGGRDALIRADHPRALARRIPGAVLHEIADGGHNVHLSHAEEFNQRVLGFLDRAGPAHAH